MTSTGWTLERFSGSASDFHAMDVAESPERAVWSFEVSRPALVLGSTQSLDLVDLDRARARGVEVVRRRSGGGAVWVDPVSVTWVDVILPAGDPLWRDDVGRSSSWLGEVWAGVLGDVGIDGVRVFDGPADRSPDAKLVCFGGRAPGELLAGDRKVLGIAQRRTRRAARMQCALLHDWNPTPILDLLRIGTATERDALAVRLERVAAGLGRVERPLLLERLITRLDAL